MKKGTWSAALEKVIKGNKRKSNFVFWVSVATVGKLCYDITGDIVIAGAAGIGVTLVGFLAFCFVGGLICGVRDEFVKRRAARKNDDRNDERKTL